MTFYYCSADRVVNGPPMNTPPHDPGLVKELTSALGKILEPFVRPINVVSQAMSDRLERWLTRKPRLYVRFHPQMERWCLAFSGDETGMQIIYTADFSHDDPKQTLLLIDAYIEGAKPFVTVSDPMKIPPGQVVRSRHINGIYLTPVVAEIGKNWTGRIIFVDQWHRKYKSDKFEFIFTGPTEHPAKAKTKTAGSR